MSASSGINFSLQAFFDLPSIVTLSTASDSYPVGSRAAEPATGFGQFMHIVTDALGYGLPLQLGEYRGDIHHGAAHRRAGIKLLFNGNKCDIQVRQFFYQAGKSLIFRLIRSRR